MTLLQRIQAVDPATPLNLKEVGAPATFGEAVAGGFDAIVAAYLTQQQPDQPVAHLDVAALSLDGRADRVAVGIVREERLGDGLKVLTDGRTFTPDEFVAQEAALIAEVAATEALDG